MAFTYHIGFGTHLIFTYGPLGFLSVPTLWFSHSGLIAIFYTVVVRIAFVTALFAAARRSYGLPVAILVTLALASASSGWLEPVPFLVFAIWVVDRVEDGRWLTASIAGAAAVAGIELLNKASTGIELIVLAIVMAACARGRRRVHLAAALVALVVGLVVGWLAAGQSLTALPDYLRSTQQIVSGYASAMGLEAPGLGWQYTASWAVLAFGVIGAFQMTGDGASRRRWGIVLLWVAFWFFEFKEAFVRHDSIHGAYFFVAAMGGFIGLRWRPGHRAAGLSVTAALFVFTLMADGTSFATVFNPAKDASAAFTEIGQVASHSKRYAIISAGRTMIGQLFPIDPKTLALLAGHTVQVSPYETAVAWAYRLDWQPLPIFQTYSAYTPALDEDNARAMNSPDGPQRILRNRDSPIDNRVQTFDEPLATRTMFCRYRQLRVTPVWQVLARAPNRCSAPTLIRSVRANWDRSVSVPAPPNDHSFVFVRIAGTGLSVWETLYSLLYKPDVRAILLDGYPYRLVEATAGDGLLLRAPSAIDYSSPFGLAPNPAQIAVSEIGSRPGKGDPITYSFYSVSVSSGARA
jgi:hypothetical protein